MPLLGDDTLEALPLMLLCCSKPEATAADAYKAWLDQSALHPIVGTLVLEWTGDRNDSRCPDLFFINVLLMSLFLPPLLLKHGLAMLHSAAVDAGILNHGIKYKYSMETGFVAQPGALIHQGRQVMDMTPAELAALPPSVLEQALSNVQFEQATLLQQQVCCCCFFLPPCATTDVLLSHTMAHPNGGGICYVLLTCATSLSTTTHPGYVGSHHGGRRG